MTVLAVFEELQNRKRMEVGIGPNLMCGTDTQSRSWGTAAAPMGIRIY